MLTMHPSRHEPLNDGPWIRTLREKTGNPRLFIYRHRKTKRFVLAEWLHRAQVYGQGRSTCTEVMTFSGPPDHFPDDMPPFQEVVWRCRPGRVVMEEARDRRREEERREGEAIEAENEERLSVAKWLRKKGLQEAAFSLEAGGADYVSEATGGDEAVVQNKELAQTAKHRIISIPKIGEV